MSKIWLGPSGRLIEGHVLDCARSPLEAKLRDYDSQLYVKWNPTKLRGWGCWEVRRRPEKKRTVYRGEFNGGKLYTLEYVENGFESHIMDVGYLNYGILTRLKEIDTWQQSDRAKNFGADLEYREEKAQEKIKAKALEDRAYAFKQQKSMVRDLMEFVNSGGNPYRIADHWDQSNGSI